MSSDIQKKLREFAQERNWEQFHSPKNLVMALSGEVGELTEIFQWLTEEQSSRIMNDSTKSQNIKEEIADIYLYLLRLADVLDINVEEEAKSKMIKNGEKYPIDKAKGNAKKYTEF